jgi:hypothetical protein
MGTGSIAYRLRCHLVELAKIAGALKGFSLESNENGSYLFLVVGYHLCQYV